jgi:ParB-like nuclease domain
MAEIPFRVASQEFDPEIPVEGIREHPDNPNQGDVGAISESLDEHGFFGAVGVQRSTGYILWGNHRYRTAMIKGAATVPGFWLDVDDDAAGRILLVDNRTTHLATFDERKLVELLTAHARSGRGLAGTGYDGDDLDDLIQALTPPDLRRLAGQGGGAEDLLPEVKVRVEVADRQRFYDLTDASPDSSDKGRFLYLLGIAEEHQSCG